MVFDPIKEPWPPSYDAEERKEAIKKLATSGITEKGFYTSTSKGGTLCQGDVIEFSAELPVLDESGEPALDAQFQYWLVTGNTCDLDREIKDAAWTQLVPVIEQTSVPDEVLAALQRYRLSRRFHLPRWQGAPDGAIYVADFLRPVALHKAAIDKVKVAARMSSPAWILLHSCFVRFLARDDRRFVE